MLLYYTEDGPPISNSILEYISDGRIKVKKLPYALEKSYPLLLYDIGIRHEQEPDTEFVLWGRVFVEGVYKLLFSYDMKIRGKLKFKKIIDFAKKDDGQKKAENWKNPESKQKSEEKKGEENEKKNAAREKEQQEKTMGHRSRSEEQRKDTRGEDRNLKKEKNKGVLDTGTGEKKERSTVETKNTNMYEKANQCFQDFLKEILGELPSDTDTNNVMLAVLDVHDIVQKEEMFECYKESLRQYFSSERRADYYYRKTKGNLEEMRRFMMD